MDNNPNYYNGNQPQGYDNSQGYYTQFNTPYNNQYYNQYNQYNGQYKQYNDQYGRIYSYGTYDASSYYNNGYNTYNGYNQQTYAANSGVYSYYQNLYNLFGGHNPVVDKEFEELSRRGLMTGALMLGIFMMQIVASFFLAMFSGADYVTDAPFSMGMGVITQIIYMLVPALVVFFMSKSEDRDKMLVFNKPKSWMLYILGVFAGLGLCLIGNAATSFFSVFLSFFGVTFLSGSEGMAIPTSAIGILIFVVNTAVMPALLEEFAFRGVVMQPLRKYGDWFAILASSFCFAIVHANMVQIPFAFVAGVSLGYFCIKTKSIWTSVTIHFLNNLLSVIFSVYFEKYPSASVVIYYVVTAALILLGVAAMIVFRMNCSIRTKKDTTVMNKHKTLKKGAFAATPTITIALFFATFTSVGLTQLTSVLGLLVMYAGLFFPVFFLLKWIRKIKTEKSIKPRKMYTASMILTICSCVFLAFIILITLSV